MLRCYLQNAANVMAAKLPKEFFPGASLPALLPVRKNIVESNSGADEDLLNTLHISNSSQYLYVIPVIRIKLTAGLREKAVPAAAHAVLKLLLTGGISEICCRTPHIMNVSLKCGILRKKLRLRHNRFQASASYLPTLVIGYGAECTSAEAPSV